MKIQYGRHIYGLGAIGLGVITLVWHQIDALGSITHPDILVYLVGAVEIVGGLAIQWPATTKFGALTLGVAFSVFTLYWTPFMVRTPLVFWPWGNFFEQFSVVLGSLFILASTLSGNEHRAAIIVRVAFAGYGICVITYALYQLFYLKYTASLVPVWIPPGQMFWGIATTIFFALAAIALLAGLLALLASRLLTVMLVFFGFLVWLPPAFAHPLTLSNWREFAENLLMAGVSWIVMEILTQPNLVSSGWPLTRRLNTRAERGRNRL